MTYFLVMAPDIIRSFYMYINFIVIMNNEWIMLVFCRGRSGRDRMVVGFTTMQSVPITTDVVSLNLDQSEV
jgi:hypothetical protein